MANLSDFWPQRVRQDDIAERTCRHRDIRRRVPHHKLSRWRTSRRIRVSGLPGNLLPWLTVAENIAFPLKIKNVPKARRSEKVEALLDRFNLKLDLNARTYTLSGGQAQIASIVRALVIEPEILIMDEPFSALDYQTNLTLYEKMLFIWQSSRVTILLVSHDIDTALYLGERTIFLTKRPASIAGILENKLTGPKELSQMASNDFSILKRQALEIFQHEALRK